MFLEISLKEWKPISSKRFHLSPQLIESSYNIDDLFREWHRFERSLLELHPHRRPPHTHSTGDLMIDCRSINRNQFNDSLFDCQTSRFQCLDGNFLVLRGAAYYPGVENADFHAITRQIFSDLKGLSVTLCKKERKPRTGIGKCKIKCTAQQSAA